MSVKKFSGDFGGKRYAGRMGPEGVSGLRVDTIAAFSHPECGQRISAAHLMYLFHDVKGSQMVVKNNTDELKIAYLVWAIIRLYRLLPK